VDAQVNGCNGSPTRFAPGRRQFPFFVRLQQPGQAWSASENAGAWTARRARQQPEANPVKMPRLTDGSSEIVRMEHTRATANVTGGGSSRIRHAAPASARSSPSR